MDLGLTLYSQKEATVTSSHFLPKRSEIFCKPSTSWQFNRPLFCSTAEKRKNSPRKQKNNKLGGKKYYFLISRFDDLRNQTQFFKKAFRVKSSQMFYILRY